MTLRIIINSLELAWAFQSKLRRIQENPEDIDTRDEYLLFINYAVD